jgi:hypothetical protein
LNAYRTLKSIRGLSQTTNIKGLIMVTYKTFCERYELDINIESSKEEYKRYKRELAFVNYVMEKSPPKGTPVPIKNT